MKEIQIGGIPRQVPPNYIEAECKYTQVELAEFYASPQGKDKKRVRAEVLAKRIEFYDKYSSGKIRLDPITQPTQSTFSNIINWLSGAKWRR
jgi:hypothetical protein